MEDGPTLLIVEDNQRFADTLAAEFRDRGYRVDWCESLAEVRDNGAQDYNYAVVDLRLRQDSGLEVISLLKERSPDTIIAIAGAHAFRIGSESPLACRNRTSRDVTHT